jgi:3-oxoacyl-[acyl-carrier-protein] synthase II
MVFNDVVISSWGALFGDYSEHQLVEAAFQDKDLAFHAHSNLDTLIETIPEKERQLIGPHALKACLAVEKAMSKAQLWRERNCLRGKGQRFRQPRAAIIAGSSLGMIGSILQAHQESSEKLHPYTLSKLRGNSIAAPLAIRFGFGAGDFSLSAASATGGQAIWLGSQLIRSNIADVVVVVCADVSKSSKFAERALKAVGAVASSFHSRPLCAKRDGMRPIDASVAIVLESAAHAAQRKFQPLARWVGGSVKNDCHHLIAPEPNALGLEEAVHEALSQMKKDTTIDWLSLHATGTKAWDFIEANLIHKLFSPELPHISAFKRTFGHTLGSGCLLSIAMLAEGLQQGRLPIIPQEIDPAFNLNLSPKTKAKRAMNWSAGMGGTVAVNILESYHAME